MSYIRVQDRPVLRNHHREIPCFKRCLHSVRPLEILRRTLFYKLFLRKPAAAVKERLHNLVRAGFDLMIVQKIDESENQNQNDQKRCHGRQDKTTLTGVSVSHSRPEERSENTPVLWWSGFRYRHPAF